MGVNDFFRTHKRIVVLDTEFTTWEGSLLRRWAGVDEYREIFQVSAQMVDLAKCKVVDAFDYFVYPRIHSQLSDYAKKLTGVTQAQVDMGIDFKEMYMELLVWTDGLPVCSYVRSAGIEGEGEVLKENIDLYNLELPYVPSRFLNLTGLFKGAGVDVRKFSSGELYKCFNLELPGKKHNANHDVNSLVASIIALKEEVAMMSK